MAEHDQVDRDRADLLDEAREMPGDLRVGRACGRFGGTGGDRPAGAVDTPEPPAIALLSLAATALLGRCRR